MEKTTRKTGTQRAENKKGANFGSGFILDDNMFEPDQQLRAHRRLLWAVINLAVEDACRTLVTSGSKHHPPVPLLEAQSAIRFLMTDSSDGYFMWLNVDGQSFRRRLLTFMYAPNPKKIKDTDKEPLFSDEQKKNFQLTYDWLYKISVN